MANFYCLVGLPYSGKSTYGEKLRRELDLRGESAKILSSDAIREEFYGTADCQANPALIMFMLEECARNELLDGNSVIYDATNISYRTRMKLIKKFSPLSDKMICVFLATPFDTLMERKQHRRRVVPTEAIRKMYTTIWIPNTYEGWDEVRFVYPDRYAPKSPEGVVESLCGLSHDNPHHTVSVGQHLKNAKQYVQEQDASDDVVLAAELHDIGKPFTKSFVNGKGVHTETAHFFGHEHVSAYDALFYIPSADPARAAHITALIQWHMAPYNHCKGTAEGSFDSMKAALNDTLLEEVMLLHEADLRAG